MPASPSPLAQTHLPVEEQVARLPKMLSPSRAKDFKQCPRKFYYKTILKMRSAATVHTARGTLAHAAFEQVMIDWPKGERTVERAVAYVRPHWDSIRGEADYANLIAEGPEFEEELVSSAEECVRGWFVMENPNLFDPIGIEVRMEATFNGVTMHGIIDRFDRITMRSGEVRFVVSDYKTGKAPSERYLDDAMFAMKIYAVFVYEMLGVIPHSLRLIHVREARRDAVYTMLVDEKMIERTKKQMGALWKGITNCAKTGLWAPKTGPLCPWCDQQDICPAQNPQMIGLPLPEENFEKPIEPTEVPVTIGSNAA